MASYRELLAAARAEIDEISTPEAHALLERNGGATPLFVDVRLREEWDEGHLPGAVHVPRNNLESRVEALIPDKTRPTRRLLRERLALGVRARDAARARLRERRQPRRRLRRLEAERLRARDARGAHAGAARPLRAAPADPRGRRGGPAEAARLARPPDRRRRPRLARVALPRGRRRRHARDHRRRHRRRLQPPATDRPLDRAARRAEGRLRRSGRSRRSTPT